MIDPKLAAKALEKIAMAIDKSKSPSVSRVAGDISRVYASLNDSQVTLDFTDSDLSDSDLRKLCDLLKKTGKFRCTVSRRSVMFDCTSRLDCTLIIDKLKEMQDDPSLNEELLDLLLAVDWDEVTSVFS